MDQHMNMTAVQQAGAGLLLRSEYASPSAVREKAKEILSNPSYRQHAVALGQQFGQYQASTILRQCLDEAVQGTA
jgi:UDP:flavonoid glycosyltransferase YjiC (YdhE family)